MQFMTEAPARARSKDAYDVEYRGYVLKCRPQPTPHGRYLPYLIVWHGSLGIASSGFVPHELPAFERAGEAAERAAAAGMRWVDEYG